MSDGEVPDDPGESSEVMEMEIAPQLSHVTPDSPSQTPEVNTTDNSADVTPTQKTRRRPEAKPQVEVQEKTEEKPKPEKEQAKASSESTVAQGGWGYWGSWGKSILSTATATVATVGQGVTQMIEKAETSLGIPSPTELSAHVEQQDQLQGEASSTEPAQGPGEGGSPVGSAMGMLSSLTSVVQSTGKTVITGGLDALEFIGKKTMDVIAEGDPGFKKTKGLMIRTSTLSQVLREAKEREEQQTAEEESSVLEKKAHYGMLFDQFQGLSHLEALEILSRESELKVKSVLTTLSGEDQAQLREDLELIKEPFSLVEFDDDEVDEKRDADGSEFLREVTDALEGLHITATASKLGKASRSACEQIAEMTKPVEAEGEEEETKTYTVEDVHSQAIRSLAELTARSIELFHKLAEMVLFSHSPEVTTLEQARILAQLTNVLCKEVSLLSKKFTSCLTTLGSNEKGDVLNPLITGVFLEASNSASYVQDAFQLLMPVLQVSHIQRSADSTQQ